MVKQKQKFFVVVPPGFENLALAELKWRGFAIEPIAQIKGGLEFECEMGEGLALNYLSHIGTRVLLRLSEFRCRDFPKLFNKIREMKWSQFIGPKGFNVEVSAKRSRLMNKKRITETVNEAVEKSLKVKKLAGREGGTDIYIRFDDDTCFVSLDTTGEALFKRGYKTLEALAPLRENLAAGLFFALYDKLGRPSSWRLVDPLCGSGTFLTESALFFKNESQRKFDFHQWYKEPLADFQVPESRYEIYGFDRHEEAIGLAKSNLSSAKISHAKIEQKDFLKESLASLQGSAPLIGIANPPYGVRIQLPAPPTEFYSKLIGTYENLGSQIFGFIVPRGHLKFLPKPTSRLDFSNGGIDVSFAIYAR